MKTIYKSIFVIGLGIVSLTAAAQKDSTLIRQVLLEREYNPTLQDASKINTMPSIYSPAMKTRDVNYISSTPRITLSNSQLGTAESGDIKTNVDFSKKRGYLNLGAGTHSNLDGALGYRIVNAERDRLDIFATHSSTSGNVDYIDGSKYLFDEVKAKYSASKVNLKYQHTFDPSILSIGASYYNTSYNYYGNSFAPNGYDEALPFDFTSRQNVDVFGIGAGLKSSANNGGELKYEGNISYQNFKSKYGVLPLDKGPKGGQIDVDVNFFSEFGSDKAIGIRGALMNQSFSSPIEYEENAYHGLTTITGTPYFKIEGGSWNVNLGVNLSAAFDVKTKFLFSPNIKAEARVYDVNVFYGEVTGGINNNTYLDILRENRYVNLFSRVAYSKTLFDAKVGFKSGVVSGFEFDIFAGYKKTDNDHLFLATNSFPTAEASLDPSVLAWGNVGTPFYAKIGTGHVGGLLKTNLIPLTDLSARITAYFYDVKYAAEYVDMSGDHLLEKKAWGRPTFTAELNADVKPMENLTLSVGYLYGGGRKTFRFDGTIDYVASIKMKDINELNFKGEYKITDWVSVNARLNNVLNQKYELQYGYPLQGFNVLGGLNFKF